MAEQPAVARPVAFVTGASYGIGAATALALAHDGYDVAIAATRLFISADTGPMHLGSSTCVPTVALFQASDPTLYGPLKSSDVALNISHISPRDVAERCQRLWRDAQRADDGRAPGQQ